jgi:CMP-N-acetylneuraminic acid synthetase
MAEAPPTFAALVPMRHTSERVPGKNYRVLGDKPLYHHIVQALQACPLISEIVINTDSPTIMADARAHFPAVRLLERPEHLRAGTVPMNDVLLYDVQHVEADFYVQTHSTNPLLKPATIARALEQFCTLYPMHDSMFAVTRIQNRLWDALTRPVNHNPAILLRTQDLPPIYAESSSFYIFSRQVLETRHNRIGERPYMFEVDPIEAWDIDEEIDFQIVASLYQMQ